MKQGESARPPLNSNLSGQIDLIISGLAADINEMKTIVLIGTNHNFQRPVMGPYAEGIEVFRHTLHELCLQYKIHAIAEEMSLHALHEHDVEESVAQQVCADLGLLHQLSDPSPLERSELGILQDNDIRVEHMLDGWTQEQIEADVLARGSQASGIIRECFWWQKIQEFDTWPLLFICGADHFSSFTDLLNSDGVEVIEACRDWEPKT